MRCFSHMHWTTEVVCDQAFPLTVLGMPCVLRFVCLVGCLFWGLYFETEPYSEA